MTQSQLFERDAIPHMEALERFAFRLCRDVHWSRDLVQETMLKAFTHFDMFRQGTNCRAWLFKICKYSFINAYRSRQRQPVLMDFGDDAPHSASGNGAGYQYPTRGLLAGSFGIDPHSRIIGDEVMTALQSLPLVFQTAVILSDIEGHPYEEIAEFLHVPLGTVRSRLHRGRGMLARRLTVYAREAGYTVVS
jgi:RNA polymerase sigma-70 factor (ECF subfamily)